VDGFTLEGAATFDGAGDQAVVTGPITTQDEVLKTTPGALRFFGSDVDLNGDVIVTDGNLEVNASTSLHVAGTLGAWLNLIVFNDLTLDGAGAQTIDSGSGNVTLAAETIKTTAGDLTLSAFHDVLLPQRLSVTDGHLVVTSDDALVGADLIEVSNGDAIFDTDVTFNGPTTVDAATVRLVQEVVVGFGSVQNFNALGGITFEPASELLIEFADPYTFDQVIAGGEVELQGGALRVTIPEEPPTGMAYPVILAGTRIGEFGTVTIEVGDPPVPSTRGSVTYEPDEVVLHFDDPAGIGGCCLTSGICWTTTFASCQSVGGAWQGAASSCATVTCPIPIGSCCLPGDICLNLTLAACQAFTGAYQGNGSDCTACVPATGSCCLPSGACTDGVTADVCAAMPGAYQGDGTTCAGDPCPPPPPTGACCLPDGACTEVLAGPCISVGGTFFGPASTCAVVSCPSTPLIGACCYSGGTCGPTQQATCLQAGGLWLGPASSCATNPCPTPTGACCLGDNCVVLPSLACLTMGGTYKGHGTECPASCN
ncbi:MAG: hypothetical protein GY715_09270, partial [Planctomycetes bacterium]|nr:hypothetical protein [Planctomycetota bacterium]